MERLIAPTGVYTLNTIYMCELVGGAIFQSDGKYYEYMKFLQVHANYTDINDIYGYFNT